MRFASISSGSSGNVSFVSSGNHHILLDAGVGIRSIESALRSLDISCKELDGICVTHEHIDHIKAIGSLCRKYSIPVYASLGTLQGILLCDAVKEIPKELLRPILTDESFSIGDLSILPFSVSHDTLDPVAYRVSCGDKAVAVITDLGCYDEYTISHLQNLDVLLLEANHDVSMVEKGPYPLMLKRRILSNVGHLSNLHSGELLKEVLHPGLKRVFLGHLSAENNNPDLALATVKKQVNDSELDISLAKRSGLSDCVEW